MVAVRALVDRLGTNRTVAAGAAAVSLSALIFATEIPSNLFPNGGASAAIAELLARSPGHRIGGVALKSKRPRAKVAALAKEAPADKPGLATPVSSMMGVSVPEGPVPGSMPAEFPSTVVPASVADTPATTPGSPGVIGGGPGGGGVPIFGGGGTGGGTPTPTPTPTETTPVPTPTPTVPVVTPAIPEPATWLMLIGGFGIVGGAMRRRRREAFA